jgi:GST-like protein
MFQVGGVGPMMGQLGFFHVYGGKDFEDKRPLNRYLNETKRLLGVLDKQLSGRDWIAGDYSIADIAIAPWLNGMERFYNAAELTELHQRTNITTYLKRFNARPAVQRGEIIPEHNGG